MTSQASRSGTTDLERRRADPESTLATDTSAASTAPAHTCADIGPSTKQQSESAAKSKWWRQEDPEVTASIAGLKRRLTASTPASEASTETPTSAKLPTNPFGALSKPRSRKI